MNQNQVGADRLTLFWPFSLVSLSLVVFLGWQVSLSVRQYIGSVRVAEQQDLLAAQAVQTEAKFQAMVMDLMTLAKTDKDAKEIVTRYGIQFNSSPSQAQPAEVVRPKLPPLPVAPDKDAVKPTGDASSGGTGATPSAAL